MKRAVSSEACGQLVEIFSVFLGTSDNLVVDVGNVAHVSHIVTLCPQPTQHDIEHHHHPRMADVAVVVNRHAAYVHPHLARFDRLKHLLPAGQAIVNLQHGWLSKKIGNETKGCVEN